MMAEYINRDNLIKDLCTISAPTPSESWIVEKCIEKANEQPTADLVPKSEVADLQDSFKCLEETNKHLCDEYISLQRKYDLAVAEREANVKGFTEELAKVKTEVASEIFEYIECMFSPVYSYTGEQIKEYIAELKKKYTEEKE